MNSWHEIAYKPFHTFTTLNLNRKMSLNSPILKDCLWNKMAFVDAMQNIIHFHAASVSLLKAPTELFLYHNYTICKIQKASWKSTSKHYYITTICKITLMYCTNVAPRWNPPKIHIMSSSANTVDYFWRKKIRYCGHTRVSRLLVANYICELPYSCLETECKLLASFDIGQCQALPISGVNI